MCWSEFDVLASLLTDKLTKAEVRPDVIIAIARGGLVLATVLAHRLHCRSLGVLTIRRTLSDRPFSLPPNGIHLDLVALPEHHDHIETILLVDDIIGHGLTLSLAKRLLFERYPGKRIVLAALVDDVGLGIDPSAQIDPYLAAYEMADASWVVFPWESDPDGYERSDGQRNRA